MNTGKESGVIYLLTSPSGKQYVGQSWNYEKRMWQYRSGKGRGQTVLHRAVIKHGWDNFTSEILERGIETQEALDAAEDAFIMSLNTMSPHGYNLKRGGMGGKHNVESITKMSAMKRGKSPSAETRAKISAALRGERNHNFGKSHSLETRKKIGAKSRGRTPSTETRAKLREAQLGKTMSSETRAKISESMRGKPKSLDVRAKMSAGAIAAHARKRAASSSTPLL